MGNARSSDRGQGPDQGWEMKEPAPLLISPCDGLLSCIPIRENVIFDIKHTRFSLEDLLRDPALARDYANGYALIFRLTPAHYHRYCYAVTGRILGEKEIPGRLHCVRPLATREVPVYAQNARKYQVLETSQLGRIVQMEVGAMMIGRITNLPRGGRWVIAGEEKGYFEFGGSTIVLLVQKCAGERMGWEHLPKECTEREIRLGDPVCPGGECRLGREG